MAALKALVIGMGVLIVAGTVTLVVLLVQRANEATSGRVATDGRPAAIAPGRTPELALGAPEGSRVGGITGAGGALAIWVMRPDGDRVVLVDPASGRQTGEIRLRD